MIEIPEAATISAQINDFVARNVVAKVITAQSPHKFAWYQGDPEDYSALLTGKMIQSARPVGGMVEITLDDALIVLSEGAIPSYYETGEELPKKHQLFLQFVSGAAMAVSVRMYGGILAFPIGKGDNPYYLLAQEKPSPLSDEFDSNYFETIHSVEGAGKLSAKALLATEQRIPGLGNGSLQDILYNAKIHPKRKVHTFSTFEKTNLFKSVKETLAEMTRMGGRDTEQDLFKNPGGYQTKCSKFTIGSGCGVCGDLIQKASYMGGSVYFCPTCQTL